MQELKIKMALSIERWSGKTAVVTGASAGIGKSIVEVLVKQGLVVAGIARRTELLEELRKTLKKEKGHLFAYKCDLAKEDEIPSVFKEISKKLGPIHILINSAGLGQPTHLIDGNVKMWKTVLDINVLALSICTKEAIANMKDNGTKGHIIHINSVLGHVITDIPGFNFYPASKFAVTALAETLRLEINREKLPIKITSLSPGYVKTEFPKTAFENKDIFIRRPGLVPEDVASAVVYILSTPEHVNVKELTLSVQGSYS